MKRIIVTVCTAVLAATAVHAQGRSSIAVIDRAGQRDVLAQASQALPKNVQEVVQLQAKSLAKALERQVLEARIAAQAAACAEQEQSSRAASSCPSYYYGRAGKVLALADLTREKLGLRERKKDNEENAAYPSEKENAASCRFSSCPSYYYGRAGKVLALADLTREKLGLRERNQDNEENGASADTVTQEQTKREKTSWFRRVFLGGRYPQESHEAYQVRLAVQSQPACQPFK